LDERISYVSISYGMIESPVDEAYWETAELMRSRGASESDIDEATPLIKSAIKVVASGFDEHWEEFLAQEVLMEEKKWVSLLSGSPVEKMLSFPKWVIKIIGPMYAPEGLDWYYSSESVLEKLDIPMIWHLAEEDRSAPNKETIKKLNMYGLAGKPFESIIYPEADHGILTFKEENGSRKLLKYSDDYFQKEVESIIRMSKLNNN
ncbi:MAG: hypothetical protein OQJ89_03575, partial [Kangiellaceae bacterium]|nr:hypothetical protein [Kangiellaceae bacterium]